MGEDAAEAAAKGLLEKKWNSVLRLQKKLMQMEEENKQLKESSVLVGPGKRPTQQLLPIAPPLHTLKGHRGGVGSVAFHPQYGLVATASEDASLKIWDTESGELERTLKGHTNAVNRVVFSHSGATIASASSDLTLKLWSVETYDCLKTLAGHDHAVSDVAYTVDDSQLVSCSRNHS